LFFKKIDVPCDGSVLYNWASGIEKEIYELLDSFLPLSQSSIEGHNELFALDVLRPEYLRVDGEIICSRILFMLDDVHKLSPNQRETLISHLLENRRNVSLWLSERLEALNNLRTNSGRDYEELNLENYWKDKESKFEKLLTNISVKRAAESREDVEFALEPQLNEQELNDVYCDAKDMLFNRIDNLTRGSAKFDLWKSFLHSYDGTAQEMCLLAKQVEILIHRNISKSELDLDFQLTVEEFNQKADEKVAIAARLFLSKEFNIPYYYGIGTLSKISTNNVEQFLGFSAPLYERMLSLNLSQNNVSLSAREQDKEIRHIANEKWKELPKIVPDSSLVVKFLEALCTFCYSETFRPNAPYAPGVNGFYIDPTKAIRLFNEEDWLSNENFSELQIVLNNCLAYNLLHVKETMQGKKGQKKNVYYLNRWLCVKFDLPLNYGGWRTRKPDELLRWIRK
jgi:hypothetical protein